MYVIKYSPFYQSLNLVLEKKHPILRLMLYWYQKHCLPCCIYNLPASCNLYLKYSLRVSWSKWLDFRKWSLKSKILNLKSPDFSKKKYFLYMWCFTRFGTICVIAEVCNFTESNTGVLGCFSRFLKLYKWYQIEQSTAYTISSLNSRLDLVVQDRLRTLSNIYYWIFHENSQQLKAKSSTLNVLRGSAYVFAVN